jgi:spermidine synthase
VRPWVLLDSVRVPEGGDLCLYERGGELAIHVGGRVLMTSRVHGSEETLADAACAPIRDRADCRVLVGGLGMGYTLAAALRHVSPTTRVVVAEVVPAVVAWNRGPLAHLAGNPLSDARVTVREEDVTRVIKSDKLGFDAILLDLDNGPKGLSRSANDWLYGAPGLARVKKALRTGGVLGVWSAQPDRVFESRLRGTGLVVSTVRARAHRDRGARHIVWLARN